MCVTTLFRAFIFIVCKCTEIVGKSEATMIADKFWISAATRINQKRIISYSYNIQACFFEWIDRLCRYTSNGDTLMDKSWIVIVEATNKMPVSFFAARYNRLTKKNAQIEQEIQNSVVGVPGTCIVIKDMSCVTIIEVDTDCRGQSKNMVRKPARNSDYRFIGEIDGYSKFAEKLSQAIYSGLRVGQKIVSIFLECIGRQGEYVRPMWWVVQRIIGDQSRDLYFFVCRR